MRATTKILLDQRPCKFKSNGLAILFMALIATFIVLVIYVGLYVSTNNAAALKAPISHQG